MHVLVPFDANQTFVLWSKMISFCELISNVSFQDENQLLLSQRKMLKKEANLEIFYDLSRGHKVCTCLVKECYIFWFGVLWPMMDYFIIKKICRELVIFLNFAGQEISIMALVCDLRTHARIKTLLGLCQYLN